MSKESIRITVVGTGRMGFFHARLLHRLGFLDSIVEPDSNIAKKVGQQFNVPYYPSIEELARERKPNGAIVAVPTNLHAKVALEVVSNLPSLNALLIEKPVATSVTQALELKKTLQETNIKTIVGHVEVFNPVISRIIEMLDKKVLGKPRSALFQRRGAVAEARLKAIGDVYEDIGVHDFDVAMRLFPKGKLKLFSTAVTINDIGNSSIIVLTSQEEGFIVTFLMSREFAGKLRSIDIEGTKATLCANLLTQILELRSLEIARGEKDASAIRIPFSNGEQIKVYGEPLLSEMWNLVDCIRGDGEPLVTIDDGINALKLVEAARKSIKTGKVIDLEV
ncbi:MAG: Gfo/Idh/MocA family protein [Candidatus Hodarchaeales archaeon]|jgi:UDP-N-acetylglucosamine 3-dehydrogenase